MHPAGSFESLHFDTVIAAATWLAKNVLSMLLCVLFDSLALFLRTTRSTESTQPTEYAIRSAIGKRTNLYLLL